MSNCSFVCRAFHRSQVFYVPKKENLCSYSTLLNRLLGNKKRLNESLYVRLTVLPWSAMLIVRSVPANSLLSLDTFFSRTGKDGTSKSDLQETAEDNFEENTEYFY